MRTNHPFLHSLHAPLTPPRTFGHEAGGSQRGKKCSKPVICYESSIRTQVSGSEEGLEGVVSVWEGLLMNVQSMAWGGSEIWGGSLGFDAGMESDPEPYIDSNADGGGKDCGISRSVLISVVMESGCGFVTGLSRCWLACKATGTEAIERASKRAISESSLKSERERYKGGSVERKATLRLERLGLPWLSTNVQGKECSTATSHETTFAFSSRETAESSSL